MNKTSSIPAVVLAAGCSSRMGPDYKLLLKVDDKSIIRCSVENVLNSRAREVIVVLGAEADKVEAELRHLDVRIIRNRNYRQGMSTSLVAGVNSVRPESKGVLILLGDQPELSPETLNEFIDTFNQSRKEIIAGRYHGVIGNPVLFHRKFFPEMAVLTGDVGARSLLKRHSDQVATIQIPDDEILDIDTPEDFAQWHP